MHPTTDSPPTKIAISIVVPVVDPQTYLHGMIDSVRALDSDRIEVIFVNQSQTKISDLYDYPQTQVQFIDRVTGGMMPAPKARNLGASIARGDYLLFLDDDACFYPAITTEKIADLLTWISAQERDIILFQRGEVRDGNYHTHWPSLAPTKINYQNFSKYAIEWNFLIKKQLFDHLGGFIDIGPGSNHACQCGEAFVLFAKIIDTQQYSIDLYPQIQIAHPGLFDKVVSLRNALGYYYATGYAVGMGLDYFHPIHKLYWLIRFISSLFYDLFWREYAGMIPIQESVNRYNYRYAIAKCKLSGFIDSFRHKRPKPKDWLDLEQAKVARI
jgi:glycosyltransferase involved in cell wall biosynthesis